MANKKIIYGLYDDEIVLIDAVKTVRAEGLKIDDCYTPFPVHGLDDAMGLRMTKLHSAGFVFGATGTLTALTFILWISTNNYPVNYGGKPYLSLPAWIPITFELTVLFAAWGMVITFYIICGMGPGVKNVVLDERISDDKFCIAFNKANFQDTSKVNDFFKATGAAEVNSKVL